MLAVGVDGAEEELVAKDPIDVDFVGGDFVLSVGAGDAGPDDDAIVAERAHGVEGHVAAASGIDDQVGFADILRGFFERSFGEANVFRLDAFDDLAVERAALAAGEGEDFDAAEAEDERGQESDLANAHDEGPLRTPDAHAALGFVGLVDGLGRAAHRLHEHVQVLETLWDADDVFLFIDKVFGEEAVAEVDATLVVGLLAGHIVGADEVVDRAAGAADGGGDVVARLNALHVGADFLNDAKGLVTDDEVAVAWRSVAVEGVVDLAVGGIDADFQHADEDAFAAGNVGDFGARNVGEVDAVLLAGSDGDGFHGEPGDREQETGDSSEFSCERGRRRGRRLLAVHQSFGEVR